MTLAFVGEVMFQMLSLTDPSASQTNSEEKLNHEAQELEKRLSMLSHRSNTGTVCYCNNMLRFKVETKVKLQQKCFLFYKF